MKTPVLSRNRFFTAVAMLIGFGSTAQAQNVPAKYNPTYTVLTPQDVRSIVLFGHSEASSYSTNSFFASAGTRTITDPFTQTAVPLYTFLLGASNFASPSDAGITPSVDHLIVAFNNDFAATTIASGADFREVFNGFDEQSIIMAADRLAGIGDGNIDDAVNELFSFSNAVHDAGADFTLGSNFTLVSFSSGALFGTGQSFATPAATTGAVPEPTTWAMMVFGFGMIGFGARYRRKSTKVSFA